MTEGLAFTHKNGRKWTEVTAGLHPGAQDGFELDVRTQQGQAVLYVDHYPVCATIQKDEAQGYLTQQKQKRDGQDGSCMAKTQEMIQ